MKRFTLLDLILLAFVAAADDSFVSRMLGGYGHGVCPYYCIYRAKALYYCVHEHDSCKDHIKDICDDKDDEDDDEDDHKDYKDGESFIIFIFVFVSILCHVIFSLSTCLFSVMRRL